MVIKAACPRCKQSYKVHTRHHGQQIQCRKCGETFTLANADDETQAPPSPADLPVSSQPSGQTIKFVHPGVRLGCFEVQRKVGAGAMGEVWLAHDLNLDRDVAIKILPHELAQDEHRLARFLREAKSAARLDHPNTATVHQAGMESGIAFIAMQYIDGGSLDQAARADRPMPWREAAQVVRDAALGLAAAHQLGIVHRDIKPSNLMRTSTGITKVVDFGLARALESDSQLTQQGAFLGTPAYMAPELWGNGEAGPRSDVYALACTFYYLLTGRTPFSADNLAGMGYQHRHEPLPEVQCFAPDAPTGVQQILAVGAAKEPADRYASAAEMAAALDALLQEPSVAAAGVMPLESSIGSLEEPVHVRAFVAAAAPSPLMPSPVMPSPAEVPPASLTCAPSMQVAADIKLYTQRMRARKRRHPPLLAGGGIVLLLGLSGWLVTHYGNELSPRRLFGTSSITEQENVPAAAGLRSQRASRWTIDFEHQTVPEYLAMLEWLGIELAVPQAGRPDTWNFYARPSSAPTSFVQRTLTGDTRLSFKNDAMIQGISTHLGISPQPAELLYYFSQSLEDRLIRLELSYANRREEQIQRTRFNVSRQGLSYAIGVTSQEPK